MRHSFHIKGLPLFLPTVILLAAWLTSPDARADPGDHGGSVPEAAHSGQDDRLNLRGGGDRYAVVIGVSDYANKNIPALRYAKADAELFYRFLTDPKGGGFDRDKVKLLTDEEASQRNVRSALGTWLARNAVKEDTVIIYYAGHGAPEMDPSGESPDGYVKYLVPHDADARDLYATGIPMKEVETIFKRIESDRVIFITDTCYSGAVGGRTFSLGPRGRALNVQYDFLEKLTQGEGRVVISSADANEVALEVDKVGHGLFTYYLVLGLQGKADADGDKQITVDEVYKYAYTNVSRLSRKLGGNQHPVRKGSIKGEIVLASLGPPPKSHAGARSTGDESERGITIPLDGGRSARRGGLHTRYYVGGGLGLVGAGSAVLSLTSFLRANEIQGMTVDSPDRQDKLRKEQSNKVTQGGVWLAASVTSLGFAAYTAFAEKPFGLSLAPDRHPAIGLQPWVSDRAAGLSLLVPLPPNGSRFTVHGSRGVAP